jgi:transcriptional regulator with XRE-family HTH domain
MRTERADDGRWESNFGRFVSRYGAEKLAGELGVDRTAVYHWVRGASMPVSLTAVHLHSLAREGGFQISFDDIYENFSRRVSVASARKTKHKEGS